MNKKLVTFGVCVVFLQVSCVEENQVLNVNSSKNFSNTKQFNNSSVPSSVVSSPTPKNQRKISKTELASYEYVIYTKLLASIYYNEDNKFVSEPVLEGANLKSLCYRKQTILPNSFTELENNSSVSSNLINNFKEVITTEADLGAGYDIKARIERVSGDRDLEKLFPKAYKEFTDTKGDPKIRFKVKALVGLSKIGFDNDMSKALIYVEYFSPDKKLQKFWVTMTLHNLSDTTSPNLEIREKEIIVIPIR